MLLLGTVDHYDLLAWVFELQLVIILILLFPYFKKFILSHSEGVKNVKHKKSESSKHSKNKGVAS